MENISISQLKAHLSALLEKVKQGTQLVVFDHNRPVAMLSPYQSEPIFIREAIAQYEYKELTPLTDTDPLEKLSEERKNRG
jgi:prevent-host-death family protein